MALTKQTLEELTGGCKTPGDVEKLYSQMLQHMINRSLEAEMQAHVGHARHGKAGGNPRNGKSRQAKIRDQSQLSGCLVLHLHAQRRRMAVRCRRQPRQRRPVPVRVGRRESSGRDHVFKHGHGDQL